MPHRRAGHEPTAPHNRNSSCPNRRFGACCGRPRQFQPRSPAAARRGSRSRRFSMAKRGLSYLLLIAGGFAAVGAALAIAGPTRRQAPPPPGGTDATTASFANWETGQVHPVDLTPDGTRLLVCNTADARLEVFD